MSKNRSDPKEIYERDELTNQILTEYPIQCIFRTGALEQKTLHAHDGFEFYLCLRGSGFYIVGDRLFPLHAGTLTVIPPHVVHRAYSGSLQSFHRYVLSVDVSYLMLLGEACPSTKPDLMRLLAGLDFNGSHSILTAPQFNRMHSLLEELELTLHEKSFLFELNILRIMSELVLLAAGLDPYAGNASRPRSADELLIGDVLAHLVARCHEEIRIEELLRLFPISRSRLFELFKETTGMTIKQFLTAHRLNKAKRLLADTELSITEIASRAGFGDLSHFYGLFKRATGVTPRSYRLRATQ